jgi:hypothetical protein
MWWDARPADKKITDLSPNPELGDEMKSAAILDFLSHLYPSGRVPPAAGRNPK